MGFHVKGVICIDCVLIVYWTSVESNLQLQINNTPQTHSVTSLCLLPYKMPRKPTEIQRIIRLWTLTQFTELKKSA